MIAVPVERSSPSRDWIMFQHAWRLLRGVIKKGWKPDPTFRDLIELLQALMVETSFARQSSFGVSEFPGQASYRHWQVQESSPIFKIGAQELNQQLSIWRLGHEDLLGHALAFSFALSRHDRLITHSFQCTGLPPAILFWMSEELHIIWVGKASVTDARLLVIPN